MASNIRVAVRIRPLSQKERDAGARNIVTSSGNTVCITNVHVEGQPEFGDHRERIKQFTFDFCYDGASEVSKTSAVPCQEQIYQDMGTEILQDAIEGYNACMFAYGQTGTGKTYTMMGHPGELGITPRICEALFDHIEENSRGNQRVSVEISFLEIYKERVRDLLQRRSRKEPYTLKVREHPKHGPYVKDLSRHIVKDANEIQALIDAGNEQRMTASTHIHRHSSRSHAIVTIILTQSKSEDNLPCELVSKVHLVDLAGSERADPSYHSEYKGRIKEGAFINKSLVTLGNVISVLAQSSLINFSIETINPSPGTRGSIDSTGSPTRLRNFYIPYRDSVLTWLLKDSLGGNSKTLMIATISPASIYYSDTISTLRYAQRAKTIVNKPKINEDENIRLIRELRAEIERLKKQLQNAQLSPAGMTSDLNVLYASYEEADPSRWTQEKLEEYQNK
ncbi:StAR-related lipid transfer protein 9, partial [Biomphalaria glabrata]